ncbi:MAG TPA: rhodanese-like domain-containing protein [Gemmatimonadota bacterium]|nr:rhodanese-like domain-containing protein [Gemmatimonadota bacterium]
MRSSGPLVLAAFLAACGPDRTPEAEDARRSDLDPGTADTQYVMDSAGARFMIVINRPPGAVRELKPRKGAGDPDAPEAYRVLAPDVARSMLQGARPPWRILDVRSADEYIRDGFLAGAILVDLERLEENMDDLHVRTDQMVLVYGRDTATGERAARLLVEYGFPNVRVLRGGFRAWAEAGLPVETRR